MKRQRSGLTLMELVVVLAVLVAISGLLIPLLPNMLHRANVASCTVNISEMDKIIQTQYQTYGTYPDRMDNLVIGNDLASYVLTGSTGQYAVPSIAADSLTDAEASALTSMGISNVANIVENAGGDWTPTAWPYSNSQLTPPSFSPVSSSIKVARLTPQGCQFVGLVDTKGGTTRNKYVIFGMNKQCSLFRNLASEAPYHFADTPTEDPATFYMTFGAIFQVAKEVQNADGTYSVVPLTNARFVGSVAFHNFGLATADSHSKEWWDQSKADR